MKTIQVADLKAKFSDILKRVQNEGEEYIIQYGRKHQKVAVLIPYKTYVKNSNKIRLGILDGKVEYEIKEDFEISDNEFLGLPTIAILALGPKGGSSPALLTIRNAKSSLTLSIPAIPQGTDRCATHQGAFTERLEPCRCWQRTPGSGTGDTIP